MKLSRQSLIGFLRKQTILLAVAAVVAAIFWANHDKVNPATIVLYSLGLGNITSSIHEAMKRVYWERPFPWNWLLFLACLPFSALPAYLITSAAVWWLAPPSPQSLGHLVATGWRLPVLVIVVYSIVLFAYETTKFRLERRNRELQETVEAGSAQLEMQKQELARAREIQESLLPKTVPQLSGFEIAAAWRPAREVSGDYFDVFRLGEGRLGICIADVVGKGVSAALLMANVQAAVHAFAGDNAPPPQVCDKLNRLLCENIAVGKFVTFFFGILDSQKRSFAYCNAGHLEPILVRAGRAVALNSGGAVLGVFPSWHYEERTVEMERGDRLLLFTDGISEAEGPGQEEFSETRIAEVAKAERHRHASDLNHLLLDRVDAFCGGHFRDDATLLVIAAV